MRISLVGLFAMFIGDWGVVDVVVLLENSEGFVLVRKFTGLVVEHFY